MNDPRNHNPFTGPDFLDYDDTGDDPHNEFGAFRNEREANRALAQTKADTRALLTLCDVLMDITRTYDHGYLREVKK